MGEVYEAKQISLDRPVALKTIRESLSGNAASLARFTREAYAAAQLSHHNVVQIYDFGEESGKHFFSMEWVRGGPLSELVKQHGALEPRRAASYTLQAARGLSIAHANGMVHRDIKPANLLLTDEGIVKVADLGLVKIPDLPDPSDDAARGTSGGTASALSAAASGTDMTMQGTAVGTPAYMAPEQASDAASVDHRADIYSLGCSLFFLLTGRPPFEGDQVSQVLDDHLHRPAPAASTINERVPKSLETIIEKSMAKRISDRYVTLSDMVDDLEKFLGIGGEAKFSPTREQSEQWHQIATQYAQATRTVPPIVPVLVVAAAGGLLTLLSMMMGWRWIALGPIATLTAAMTALVGLARLEDSPVMDHVRRYLSSLRGIDQAIAAAGSLMVATVMMLIGMWPAALVGIPIGILVGGGVFFGLVRRSTSSSDEAVEQARDFVRQLRMAGSDEDGVRDFCGRYGGKQWQGLYEAVFGYPSLIRQREQLASDRSFHGRTSSDVRDAFCRWLQAKSEASDQRRDRAKLERIEKQGFRAEGLSESEASDRAYQMAAALIDAARASGGNSLVGGTAQDDAAAAIAAKRAKMLAMLADARSGKYRKPRDRYATIKFLLGGQTRLVAGLLLLCGFAVWGHSHGLFDSISEIDVSGLATGQIDLDQFEVAAAGIAAQAQASGEEQTRMLGTSTSPWSLGIAGTLLVLSAFVSGWRMTPFAMVASFVIIAGAALGVPGLSETIPAWMVAGAIGLVVYLPGVIWGETEPE